MSERLRELLVKAVYELDAVEQQEVLGELLVGAAARSAPPTTHVLASLTASAATSGGSAGHRDRAELIELSTSLAAAGGDMKLLPVRLPAADYDRLRAWSREHGFSMAVIVRTLVERFLNDQARATTPAEDAPTA